RDWSSDVCSSDLPPRRTRRRRKRRPIKRPTRPTRRKPSHLAHARLGTLLLRTRRLGRVLSLRTAIRSRLDTSESSPTASNSMPVSRENHSSSLLERVRLSRDGILVLLAWLQAESVA